MSTIAKTALPNDITAEDFVAWSETWEDGERYELVDGRPFRLQTERVSHTEHKAFAWLALRSAIRAASLDCTAFMDGVSLRVDDRTVREAGRPGSLWSLRRSGSFRFEPDRRRRGYLTVEPARRSVRKLIDYFRVPSIQHYLILYGDEERVVHHRRTSVEGEIATRILGRGDVVDLSPPGFSVAVDALFDS